MTLETRMLALWDQGNDTLIIARLLKLKEPDVYRVLPLLRARRKGWAAA